MQQAFPILKSGNCPLRPMRNLAATLGLIFGLCAFGACASAQPAGVNAGQVVDETSAALTARLVQALRIAGRHERVDAVRKILSDAGYNFRIGLAEDARLPKAEGPAVPPAQPHILPLAIVAGSPGIPRNKALLAELSSAQRGHARIIVLSRGAYTLAQVAKALAGQGDNNSVLINAQGASINLPIYVGPQAELTIGSQDASTVILNAAKGAFIASAGRLSIRDTAISGSVGLNRRPHDDKGFATFLLAGDGGTLIARNTVFARLGSRRHPFGVGLLNASPDSSIAGNRFAGGYGLRIENTAKAAITENEFGNLLGPAIHVLHASGAAIRGNFIHWAAGGPGILLGENASGARVSGNVLLFNGSGIVAAMDGGGNIIEGNAVVASSGAGIGLRGRHCTLVRGNHLLANRGDGVAWRGGAADVVGNRIAFNRAAGVSSPRTGAADPGQTGELFLKDNYFQKNRVGLRIDVAAAVALENNSFSRQSPRLIAGLLGAETGTIMRARAEPVRFVAEGRTGFKPRETESASQDSNGCMAGAIGVEVN